MGRGTLDPSPDNQQLVESAEHCWALHWCSGHEAARGTSLGIHLDMRCGESKYLPKEAKGRAAFPTKPKKGRGRAKVCLQLREPWLQEHPGCFSHT